MRTILLTCLLLSLTGCDRFKKPEPAPQQHIFDGTSDNQSPIIVVDGASIHFRQTNFWMVKDPVTIEVDHTKPNSHLAYAVEIKACTPATDQSVGGTGCFDNTSTTPLPNSAGNTWNLFICSTNIAAANCSNTTAAAIISGVVSNGAKPDTDITIKAKNTTNFFTAQPNSGDGVDLALVNNGVHLFSVDLEVGTTETPLACPSLSGNQKCAIKIHYCISSTCP